MAMEPDRGREFLILHSCSLLSWAGCLVFSHHPLPCISTSQLLQQLINFGFAWYLTLSEYKRWDLLHLTVSSSYTVVDVLLIFCWQSSSKKWKVSACHFSPVCVISYFLINLLCKLKCSKNVCSFETGIVMIVPCTNFVLTRIVVQLHFLSELYFLELIFKILCWHWQP